MEHIVRTPQVGEVSHEVTIVRLHKSAGDCVQKDEPLVTVETNKASLEIESTVSGMVVDIFAAIGQVLSTGSPLLSIKTDTQPPAACSSTQWGRSATPLETVFVQDTSSILGWLKHVKNSSLSPRHKALCRDQNVIPISLHKKFRDYAENNRGSGGSTNEFYQDIPLRNQQKRLLQTLAESNRQIIPANIQCMCDNACIDQYRQRLRNAGEATPVPSRLEIIAWSVVQAMHMHPNFRSKLVGENTLRQFKNPNLGIAVAMPNDELATAIVANSFSYTFFQFVECCRASLIEAKNDNYVTTYHPIVISDLSSQGIVNAVPVVVSPACATLFIGCPMKSDRTSFMLSLSFDHRFINGAGAAAFMKDIVKEIRTITR